MIIDEGFLSNAKKISAEYPHKREVKVPEIKRENYEYQVTIMAMGGTDTSYITKRIFRNIIFKEHSEYTIKETDMIYITFAADLFISCESLYELAHSFDGYESQHFAAVFINQDNGRQTTIEYDKKPVYMLKGHIYNMSVTQDSNKVTEYLNSAKGFGISMKNMVRWMIRNEIATIEYEFPNNSTIYWTYLESPYSILSGSKEVTVDIADTYEIHEPITEKRKTRKEELSLYMEDKGIHEFVCVCLLERNIDGNMITVSFCNIYPVLYEGHYTYMTFSFEYDNRKNPDEYNHMKDMTDWFKFNYHMELTSEILINVVDKDGNIK